MDMLAELENMACNAVGTEAITDTQISRWMQLFKFSSSEAVDAIDGHRNDLSRQTVSTALWEMLAPEMELLGHDKESYEFSLSRRVAIPVAPVVRSGMSVPGQNSLFIVKLEGPLISPSLLQSIIETTNIPCTQIGVSTDRLSTQEEEEKKKEAIFCKINTAAKFKLLAWLSLNHPSFRPTIIRLAKATKDLSDNSVGPRLGIESTLPHFRPDHAVTQHPRQDEYPVWYFFYGKLAEPQQLISLLDLAEDPVYVPAKVRGGVLKIWGGKYNALIDGEPIDVVYGQAYQVMSREHEEALQFFETDIYNVVRCTIEMPDTTTDGLVFRFAGDFQQIV